MRAARRWPASRRLRHADRPADRRRARLQRARQRSADDQAPDIAGSPNPDQLLSDSEESSIGSEIVAPSGPTARAEMDPAKSWKSRSVPATRVESRFSQPQPQERSSFARSHEQISLRTPAGARPDRTRSTPRQRSPSGSGIRAWPARSSSSAGSRASAIQSAPLDGVPVQSARRAVDAHVDRAARRLIVGRRPIRIQPQDLAVVRRLGIRASQRAAAVERGVQLAVPPEGERACGTIRRRRNASHDRRALAEPLRQPRGTARS